MPFSDACEEGPGQLGRALGENLRIYLACVLIVRAVSAFCREIQHKTLASYVALFAHLRIQTAGVEIRKIRPRADLASS